MSKIAFHHHSASYQGRRPRNEDEVILKVSKHFDKTQVLLAVADGMGGFNKGDMAAQTALRVLAEMIQRNVPVDAPKARELLASYIRKANEEIYLLGSHEDNGEMGCALSGALVKGNRYLVFNVGDCRTYLIGTAGIRQLTKDHTVDSDAFNKGLISKEEVGKGLYSHALMRTVGTDKHVEPDLFPEWDFYTLKEGEILFVCSDGLWSVLPDSEIWQQFQGRATVEEAVEALCSLAYLRQSGDNITAAALELGHMPRAQQGLKSIPLLGRLEKGEQRKKKLLLPILLGASIAVLLATIALIVLNLQPGKSVPTQEAGKSAISEGRSQESREDIASGGEIHTAGGAISFQETKDEFGRIKVELRADPLSRNENLVRSVQIRYTTDGKAPSRDSAPYASPLLLDRTTTLRARVFATSPLKYVGQEVKREFVVKLIEKPREVQGVSQLDPDTRSDLKSRIKLVNVSEVDFINLTNKVTQVHLRINSDGRIQLLDVQNDGLSSRERAGIRAAIWRLLDRQVRPKKDGKAAIADFWCEFNIRFYSGKKMLRLKEE